MRALGIKKGPVGGPPTGPVMGQESLAYQVTLSTYAVNAPAVLKSTPT